MISHIRVGIGLVMLVLLCSSFTVTAQTIEPDSDVKSMFDLLDMSELEAYISEQEETGDISFIDLVSDLIQGKIPIEGSGLAGMLGNLLWQEIAENKDLLVMILVLAISCSFVKNFADIFKNTYISNVCFLMIYMELIALLMKSFLIMNQLIQDSMTKIVDFMNLLVPVFAMTLCIGMADMTAAGFYQLAFLVIYIVQWVLVAFLVPMVQIFVVVEFMNYMIPGERFTRMCELLEEGIRWCLKLSVAVIVGLNVVQGMIAPAVDRLKTSAVTKTIGVIPGVGNVSNALSEMLLGSGIVIKNSVGVAGVLILLLIALIPYVKMLIFALMYKLVAAVSEPIADKRIAGSINGVYMACRLLQQILLTALILFVVTIAIIAAFSGFAMG